MRSIDQRTSFDLEGTRELPRGTVTFLFTDVEGSTRLLAQLGDAYTGVLLAHRSIVRAAVDHWQGVEVDTQGDSFFVAFARTSDAVSCALEVQRALNAYGWPEGTQLRVRMAIHAGEAEVAGNGYVGIEVHRAARMMAAGHGGQVLVSASASALGKGQLPEGATLAELGEYRLKDFDGRELLFQLAHPDLLADFPPLRTLDYRPSNLPTPASAFVGRGPELEEITRLLASDSVRLLTLTGPGGTGKTRLALRAAADHLERVLDGVFFVDLAAVTDTDSALAVIGRVLGVTQTPELPVLEALKARLRHEAVLLLLDNVEQVKAAGGSIAELLEACPNLQVLVTSREALHIRGEHLLSVPPLSLPPAVRTQRSAEEISRFEAIQLFVERARAARPDFNLTDDNAAAVGEICRRLDGLPLAIELATARINLFTPEALRDRLSSRLKTLDVGARDLPARQQTLRATIDWSYLLLEPGEQRMFELLSVFTGIGIEAVERVTEAIGVPTATGTAALAALASLLDKSLLRPSETGDGRDEFVMLETIREFAAERLAERPDLADATRRAHAVYFTSFVERALTPTVGKRNERALSEISNEVENLGTAWQYWVASRDLEHLNQLAESLLLMYTAQGRYQSAAEVTTDLLDVLADSPPGAERARQEVTLRASLARTLMAIKGYTAEVEEAYARVVELVESQPDQPKTFLVLRDLARFYMYGGDHAKAASIGHEILRLADSKGDAGMRLDGHLMVGNSLMTVGDLPGALEQFDQGIASFESPSYQARRFRAGTDPRVSCVVASGVVLWLLGFPDRAVERANRAVDLGAELDPYSHAYGLFHSGFLHLWRSEPRIVEERAVQLLGLIADHDFPIWRALGTCLAGAANSMLGHRAEGLARLREGMDLYQGMRSPAVFWPFLRSVEAACLAGVGRLTDALLVLEEVLEATGDLAAAAIFLLLKGDLTLASGDVGAAQESYRRSLEMAQRVDALILQLQAEARMCRLRRATGEVDDGGALAAVYDRFTEGFEIPDLREARALLAGPG